MIPLYSPAVPTAELKKRPPIMLQDPCVLIPLGRDDHFMWSDPEDLKIDKLNLRACNVKNANKLQFLEIA